MTSSEAALAALARGCADLLEARGDAELAEIVRDATIEPAGSSSWQVDARAVTAYRFELLVDAEAFAAIEAHADGAAKIERAFASAVRSPKSELASCAIVLKLPTIDRSFAAAYAGEKNELTRPKPDASAILAGAIALLSAEGHDDVAARLTLAKLFEEPSEGSSIRYVLALAPDDFAFLESSPSDRDQVVAAIVAGARRGPSPILVRLDLDLDAG